MLNHCLPHLNGIYIYIAKVLKKVAPENSITGNARNQLNYILNAVGNSITSTAASLNKDVTITSRDIQSGSRIIFII